MTTSSWFKLRPYKYRFNGIINMATKVEQVVIAILREISPSQKYVKMLLVTPPGLQAKRRRPVACRIPRPSTLMRIKAERGRRINCEHMPMIIPIGRRIWSHSWKDNKSILFATKVRKTMMHSKINLNIEFTTIKNLN